MTKFLIGLVTGLILSVLTIVIGVFALARMGGEKKPAIADGSTLVLELEGEIPERAPVELPLPFLEQQVPNTVREIWDTLRKAAVDSRIQAVIVRPRGLSVGWAKLQEIRASIERFKKSGKPVVAFLENPGTREYYLATAAEKIYLPPEDVLYMKGLRAELTYLAGSLDKLGVEVYVEHAGKYKDFGDTFVRRNMSPETAEVMNSILDDIYGHLTTTIGTARRMKPEQVRELIDRGPFLAANARQSGLVDELLYEDQMLGELQKRTGQNIRKVSHRNYARIPAASLNLEGGPRIAFVVGEGGIVSGETVEDPFSDTNSIAAVNFSRLLRRVGDDDSIRGVIVRVDSPGGDAIASDAIWREMKRLSSKKPTVISMSDVAASGGYYISMTGDEILAYPGTITGSIGVVFGKANLKGLYDKVGVTKDFIYRGRFAMIDSDYTPLTPEARDKLREGVMATYKTFVSKAAAARKWDYDRLEPLAQGRAWLGSQAKKNGLIDELGGIDRAIELVRKKAKIADTEKVTLVTYPPKRTFFEVMLSSQPEATLESAAALTGQYGLASPSTGQLIVDKLGLKRWQIELWSKGGLMELMPYQITVR
jgi:protease-4